MMPKRLLEPGSGANELERLLLASHVERQASDQVRGAVWDRLVQGLVLAPGSGAAEPPAQDTAAGTAPPSSTLPDAPVEVLPGAVAAGAKLGGKLALPWTPVLLSGSIGVVVGVIATSSFFLLRTPAVSPSSEVAVTVAARTSPPEAPTPRVEESAEARRALAPSVSVDELSPLPAPTGREQPAAAVAPSVPPAPQAPSELAASRLREEAALLRQAREQLGRGSLGEAEQMLERSRMQFPDSRLQQEREALTVELLVRRGLRAEAAALARAFLEKYPNSPHAARMRRALGEGGGP